MTGDRMIYTYQDGTPLPVQRDLIQDLRNYIQCLEQVLPLENSIIEMKDAETEKVQSLNRQITDLKNFRERLLEFFRQTQYGDVSGALSPCIDEMTQILNEAVRKNREELENNSNRIRRELNSTIDQRKEKILNCLSPFMISSIYGASREYHIEYTDQMTKGTLTGYISGLEYTYALTFPDEKITVKKLLGKLNLPHMARSGVFSKEEKPKMEDLSGYIVQEMRYSGPEDFLLVLGNRKNVFRIVCKNGFFSIYEDEQEITADETLFPLIDERELSEIPEKFVTYIRQNTPSFRLSGISVDEENALENNLIFDSMKIIAEQYCPIIQECMKRNNVKTEIVIKVQYEDGTRNEKYISKEEVYSSLANIGGEGLEIAGIIGVDTTSTRINNFYLIV